METVITLVYRPNRSCGKRCPLLVVDTSVVFVPLLMLLANCTIRGWVGIIKQTEKFGLWHEVGLVGVELGTGIFPLVHGLRPVGILQSHPYKFFTNNLREFLGVNFNLSRVNSPPLAT